MVTIDYCETSSWLFLMFVFDGDENVTFPAMGPMQHDRGIRRVTMLLFLRDSSQDKTLDLHVTFFVPKKTTMLSTIVFHSVECRAFSKNSYMLPFSMVCLLSYCRKPHLMDIQYLNHYCFDLFCISMHVIAYHVHSDYMYTRPLSAAVSLVLLLYFVHDDDDDDDYDDS